MVLPFLEQRGASHSGLTLMKRSFTQVKNGLHKKPYFRFRISLTLIFAVLGLVLLTHLGKAPSEG
jgi:hypothetical protein